MHLLVPNVGFIAQAFDRLKNFSKSFSWFIQFEKEYLFIV